MTLGKMKHEKCSIPPKKDIKTKLMGFWSATSIGVGAMIGAGLFALIGIAVEIAGSLAYISF